MSELYGDGTMDPYIRRALDGAETRPRRLPARQPGGAAAGLAARLGHLRIVRAHRHHAGDRLGRRDRRLRLPARLRALGHGLRPQRPRGALRRAREAALQRRLGGQVEPLRCEHRGLRQGPRHEGRQPRPQRRREPRGLRARAARQRALRVPQRRRPQDEHLEGAAVPPPTRWPTCLPAELIRFLFLRHKPRRALEFDPEGDAIPGLFDEFDRVAAATAGQPVRGELPPDPERIFRASLVDAEADVGASRRPASGPPSATSRSSCRSRAWTSARVWRPRRARRSTTPSGPSWRSAPPSPGRLARRLRAGALPRRRPGRAAGRGRRALRGPGTLPGRRRARRSRGASGRRRRVAGSHLSLRPASRGLVARCLRGRVRRASWGARTVRVRAGCSPVSTRAS